MDDLTAEFLEETTESLDALDQDLIKLEQDPNNSEVINNIFRVMHTIKGTCGFLGLSRLETVAHSAENIMDKIRDGAISVTPPVISLVLEAIDKIKELIAYLEENEVEPEGSDEELTARLDKCAETGVVPGQEGGGGEATAPEVASEEPAPATEEAEQPKTPDLDGEIDFDPVPAPYAEGESGGDEEAATDAGKGAEAEVKTPDLDEEIDFEPIPAPYAGDGEAAAEAAEEGEVVAMSNTPAESASAPKADISEEAKKSAVSEGLKQSADAGEKKKPSAAQSIRVGLDVLENLMQMVGELVLTRNQLLQLARSSGSDGDSELNTPLQRLNLITTELQEGVMQTRMQPIGNAWAKFPRVIRDLAMELGKKIELKMVGAETELDRQMLEAIKDPLTHMVRNAADHGVENPADRVASGKGETGTVTLSAYHEGGHIIIKIADDGRGLNVDKIKAKAIANGVATEAELETMSNRQIYQFIYKPGFSTAEAVTAVSGRGVGMDVVVSNIEKIGGSVALDSTEFKGSEFVITLPLTLAIMPVLIVESCDERFAIPQIRVSEIVRADSNLQAAISAGGDGGEEGHTIEDINGAPVLRLRGRLLPLVSLSDTLEFVREKKQAVNDNNDGKAEASSGEAGGENIQEENALASDDSAANEEDSAIEQFVVVCEVGSQSFGILVDKVFHTEEIVVKPVSPILKGLEVYSGCTILGDGSVIMILDPNGIIKTAGVTNIREDADGGEEEQTLSGESKVSFLTFRAWGTAPRAIPLELVSRLEEIDAGAIEWSGNQPVIQYRGGLMRIVAIENSVEIPDSGKHEVVVFTDENRTMGLLVEEIVDIVNHEMDIKSESSQEGVMGSLVIENITHDLIDVSHFFSKAYKEWLGGGDAKVLGAEEQSDKKAKILLVDDSPFFRKFMKPVLVIAEYDVTTAEHAKHALEILGDRPNDFDLVVTDIDMPDMNGIEFMQHCKKDERFADIPFIALTSHNEADLGGDAKSLGFAGFVSKADRDRLVSVIPEILPSRSKEAA